MRRGRSHPFATRWNHNTHYYPLLASLLPTTGSVLDIGCGDGTFGRFVAREDRRVIDLDVDASTVPAASRLQHPVLATAEALPFADAAFDAVTMTMVLHHVEAERALGEAARVLAPGGVLLALGYGRSEGWRDGLHEVRDLVTHRLVSRRMQAWDPPTTKAEPSGTWSDARASARAALPGCDYRRLAMWRYLVRWRKPGVTAPGAVVRPR
ncbi:class I SAM-dependent methyltransferase [Actinotalea sp. K2]|uniref:class I SAM-dependent methyltransferase n=1 Tax=Actinotalea sp. K2 TaxID=2939438 RepID=UPI0020181395|nr:class I SAM-dependent methyltransferase [Actinotalea sp. K2]MCL3860912.1 class I SAM-dependent methyltransferase [Actinotalea sp. K2]